jgi:hypothetical protein
MQKFNNLDIKQAELLSFIKGQLSDDEVVAHNEYCGCCL